MDWGSRPCLRLYEWFRDKGIERDNVRCYLRGEVWHELQRGRCVALKTLASAISPADLASEAYALYEQFRPNVPGGKRGWGATGELDAGLIRRLARSRRWTTSSNRSQEKLAGRGSFEVRPRPAERISNGSIPR